MEEKLQQLKIMLGIDGNDEDDLLIQLLALSERKIIGAAYPFVADTSAQSMPSRYDFLQIEVAERMYNQRGAEGETSHNENGVNRTYENVDTFISRNVVPFCGVLKAVSTNAKS